jgi:hypothetical protein
VRHVTAVDEINAAEVHDDAPDPSAAVTVTVGVLVFTKFDPKLVPVNVRTAPPIVGELGKTRKVTTGASKQKTLCSVPAYEPGVTPMDTSALMPRP